MIFVVRLAHLHYGPILTPSPIDAIWRHASIATLITASWYLLSSILVCEVYMSFTRDANLGWIDIRRSYERPRLNERPIFFRCLFVILALAQTVSHLYSDTNHVRLGTGDLKKMLPMHARLALQGAASLTIQVALVGPFVYFVFLRRFAWSASYGVAQWFYNLARTTRPAGLTDVPVLMARFAFSAFLLSLLWQISNTAFTFYAGQEPLKRGQPLTNDSRDPNGSLINGLGVKKDLTRTMAFWELAIIAQRIESRRKGIYQDVDRRGASAWSLIYAQCALELTTVNTSISNVLQPKPTVQPQIQQLPRLARPVRQENVVYASPKPTKSLDVFADSIGSAAKSLGQATPASTPLQRYLPTLPSLQPYILQVLHMPIGMLFRLTHARRVEIVVFGTTSRQPILINAVRALSSLAIHSLKEDSFGQVQKDVAEIVRLFMQTIQNIETLSLRLPPHWTDVGENTRSNRVDSFVKILKQCLGDMIMVFGEYATDLGLSRSEHRLAKELANVKQEMVKKL